MALKSIEEFETELSKRMEELFGNCREFKGVLRSMPEHLGVLDSSAIFEVAFETGINPEVPYPVLHFHTTLAQKIDEDFVPGVLAGLNDLNTVINAGAYPAFGCFGYYAPLGQIYLSYRMPVNPDGLDADFDNALYYLGALYEQLDLFADYILFLSNDPDRMTFDDYMEYLDSIADLNDLEARLDVMEKYLEEIEADLKDEENED